MRRLPLILLLLNIFTQIIAHTPSVEEVLQTNQYLLLAQHDGTTMLETDVPAGRCPISMYRPKTGQFEPRVRYVGAHLIRDPFGRSPPKIMIIKEKFLDVSVQIFAINTSNLFEDTSQVKSFVDTSVMKLEERRTFRVTSSISNTLFDSTSHMLYIDFSTPQSFRMTQFYILGLFSVSANFSLKLGTQYQRSSPSSRFDWVEDHYAGKFYYKEKMDNEVFLFEIPQGSLTPTVLEGEAGTKIGKMNEHGRLFEATGGAFFSINKTGNANNVTWTSSLIPASLSAGFSCKAVTKSADLPSFSKLIVIRDNDYCMLRDGPNYDKKLCEAEKRTYMISEGLIDDGSSTIKWLLITCIVLFMLIVLLFVYIYWLRSTFVFEDDRTHPNEYETEASLFVAKQRSFPSVYQDPALLDVSVDKWH